ncbi:MAG: sulfatase-like hydrolase/transferase [Methylococcaceae bacterium]
MNTKLSTQVLIPLLSIALLLMSYSQLSIFLGGMGSGFGEAFLISIKLECLLVSIAYYLIFFTLKPNRYRYLLSLLPVLLFYSFYDYYFISFGKVFKFCDLSELPELIDVLPIAQLLGYLSVLLVFASIFILNLQKKRRYFILPTLSIITTVVLLNFAPTLYLSLFKSVAKFDPTDWSDEYTAQNGYLSALFYFEAVMNKAKQEANQYRDNKTDENQQLQLAQFLADKSNGHNVHIIMLESFFNPKSFSKISYNHSPYHENFLNLLNQQESVVISPVFGGFTAQAEFEVLCGVPALHQYGSVEFNSFTGKPTFCLPNLLSNYRTVATNSYKPNFFNAPNANKSMGFKEIYFPRQYASKSQTYLDLVDKTQFIFDGDLLAQNLEFVKQHKASDNPKPLLNYVLGVYGHMPFSLDETRHPLLLKARSHNKNLNAEYQRAINQIVYRTQALAYYLAQLIKLDPQSLIIVMGDHVPRLGGTGFYRNMGYRNNSHDSIHKPPAFYIINGQFIKKQELHQYDIKRVIFNYLTNNQYCEVYSCQRTKSQLTQDYHNIMARAL